MKSLIKNASRGFFPGVAVFSLFFSCGSKDSNKAQRDPSNSSSGEGQSSDANPVVTAPPTPAETPQTRADLNAPTPAVPTVAATAVPVPPISGVEPNFASIQEKILNTKCVVCHSGAEPAGAIDLSSYESILKSNAFPPLVMRLQPLKSNIYLVSKSGKMPPGPSKLSEIENDALEKWIASGARKNETDPIPTPTPVPTEPGGD